MANFNYDPIEGLNNTSVFVDEPTTGAAARQQFMALFNQLKDYVNYLNNQSYPANGGNANTVGGKSASYFSPTTHNHDTKYSLTTHAHAYSAITGKPTNLVYNNDPRFTWNGTIPNNSTYTLTHNLNSANILVTIATTIGNVNPTWGYKDNNSLYLYNYSSNPCNFTVKIW